MQQTPSSEDQHRQHQAHTKCTENLVLQNDTCSSGGNRTRLTFFLSFLKIFFFQNQAHIPLFVFHFLFAVFGADFFILFLLSFLPFSSYLFLWNQPCIFFESLFGFYCSIFFSLFGYQGSPPFFDKQIKAHLIKGPNTNHCKQGGAQQILTSEKKQPKCNSRVHTAYTRNSSSNERP